MMSQARPVLSLRDIKKTIKQKRIFEGLTLNLYPGEVVFLLGEKNSGKSLLLSIIAGNSSPDAGDVFFNGNKITNDWLPRDKLLYIPQAGKHYFQGQLNHRITSWQKRSRQSSAVDPLGITGLMEEKCKRCLTLSTEQRQRFSLAQALALVPRLLLIDASLDDLPPGERGLILKNLTASSHKNGMAVVYVTSHGEEALTFGDRTAILSQGRIIQTDLPQEVYKNPLSPDAAALTGDCLLLKGQATAVDDETILMDMNGLNLTCYSSLWVSPGDKLTLCLRPDLIQWDKKKNAGPANAFIALLREAKTEGAAHHLCFELRNGVKLDFKRNDPLPETIRINEEYLLWFDTKRCPLVWDRKI